MGGHGKTMGSENVIPIVGYLPIIGTTRARTPELSARQDWAGFPWDPTFSLVGTRPSTSVPPVRLRRVDESAH